MDIPLDWTDGAPSPGSRAAVALLSSLGNSRSVGHWQSDATLSTGFTVRWSWQTFSRCSMSDSRLANLFVFAFAVAVRSAVAGPGLLSFGLCSDSDIPTSSTVQVGLPCRSIWIIKALSLSRKVRWHSGPRSPRRAWAQSTEDGLLHLSRIVPLVRATPAGAGCETHDRLWEVCCAACKKAFVPSLGQSPRARTGSPFPHKCHCGRHLGQFCLRTTPHWLAGVLVMLIGSRQVVTQELADAVDQ